MPYLKDLSPESYAIIALTLTYGAYVAEVYRAGIEYPSQSGCRRAFSWFVVFPDAALRRRAAGGSAYHTAASQRFYRPSKDTALVNVIGSIDAFNQARIIGANNFNLSPVTTVALLFILITIPQARFVDRLLEREQRRTQS